MFGLAYHYVKRRDVEKEIANRKEIEELIGIQMEYQQQCQRLTVLQNEQKELQRHFSDETEQIKAEAKQRMADMEQEIVQLKTLVDSYRSDVVAGEEELQQDAIVQYFTDLAKKAYNGKKPTQKDWEKLTKQYKHYIPHLYARMKVAKLTDMEFRICMLTHLQYSTSDLAALMETTSSGISNSKTNANKKLFADKSASTLLENLRKFAYFQIDV